jgi:hypothetical protein
MYLQGRGQVNERVKQHFLPPLLDIADRCAGKAHSGGKRFLRKPLATRSADFLADLSVEMVFVVQRRASS